LKFASRKISGKDVKAEMVNVDIKKRFYDFDNPNTYVESFAIDQPPPPPLWTSLTWLNLLIVVGFKA